MAHKVVYSPQYGGFGLSAIGRARYCELGGVLVHEWEDRSIPRHDPLLVRVVEELGDRASDRFAKLTIAELKGSQYRIDEYDGYETVQEPEILHGSALTSSHNKARIKTAIVDHIEQERGK